MAIEAGRLKDKVLFERLSDLPNGSGGLAGDYVPILETFAEVLEIGSTPDLIAQGIKIRQTLKMTIRYRPDFAFIVNDKVSWRGTEFIIENMRVDPWRTYIEIIAAPIINSSIRLGAAQDVFDFTFDYTFK